MSDAASSAARALLARARPRGTEVLFWLLPLVAYGLFGGFIDALPTRLSLMAEIAILGVFVLSLDLALGVAGIVSIGHGAFFGLGAYAAGLAARAGAGTFPWSDPLLGLAIAGGAAGLVGFAVSFLVLRGSDLTRLMVTLGVLLITEEIANQWSSLTGGSNGLSGVAPAPVLGLWDFDLYGQTAFWYALAVLFALFVVARVVVGSPFGLSLRAIKNNPLRARAVGVPANARLVAIFTLSTVYAGVAGGLLAQTTQLVSLDTLSFQRSADTLLILIFGGAGTLYGGLIGAVVFRLMQDVVSQITPQFWQFWLGLVLVLLVLFARGGIMGLVTDLRARWGRPRT